MKNADKPAYPGFGYDDDDKGKYYLGMTKRECLAAIAMQGLLADTTWIYDNPVALAEDAYDIADAMLEGK